MMAGNHHHSPNYHLRETIGSPGAWGDRGFGSLRSRIGSGVWAEGERLSSTRLTCGDVELFLAEQEHRNPIAVDSACPRLTVIAFGAGGH